MDEETKDVPLASKKDLEAHSSKEASSSKQHPEPSKLVSGEKLVCLALLRGICLHLMRV